MRNYLGWVVVEEAVPGYNPRVFVEWREGVERCREFKGYADSGCTQAIEWWDERAGGVVKLEPAMRGCYRVYMEEEQ